MNYKQIPFYLPIPIKYFKKYFYYLPDKDVIKNFFIYSFGALFLRCINVIIIPLNMHKLTPTDYGSLALITSFINIMITIVGLGLRQMLSIEYFHCDVQQRKKLIQNIIIIYACFATPILFILMHYRSWLCTYAFAHEVSGWVIATSLAIIFFSFFVELFYQLLRYEQKASIVIMLQINFAFITILLTATCLWLFNFGFASVLIAQVFGLTAMTSVALYFYYQQYTHTWSIFNNLKIATSYLKTSLPFIPGMLFAWLLSSGDRWVLAQYTTLENVGIYSVADLFSQVFYFLVLYPWSGSYLPYIQNKYAQNKHDIETVEKNNRYIMCTSMLIATLLISMCCVIGKSFLTFILPKAYHEALGYIWIILMGQVFLLGSYFASSLIQFKKKTYFLAFSLAAPALFNVALNYLLVPYFGITGCVIATLISYVIYFAITLCYNIHLRKQ